MRDEVSANKKKMIGSRWEKLMVSCHDSESTEPKGNLIT